jgi:hypothetical protein
VLSEASSANAITSPHVLGFTFPVKSLSQKEAFKKKTVTRNRDLGAVRGIKIVKKGALA